MIAVDDGSISVRFRESLRRLGAAQKPGVGVPAYTRWINRRAARLVAAVAYAFKLSANSVTIGSAGLSLAGISLLVLVRPGLAQGLGVATLLALGYVFDSADGQVARLYGRSSFAGEWLDHVVDAFRSPAIHAGLAVAVLRFMPDLRWLAVAALVYSIVASGQFLSQILAEALVKRSGGEQTRGGDLRSFVLLPTDPGILCWSFALFGLGAIFSWIYAILGTVAILHSAVSMRRRYRDLLALDTRKFGNA